MKRDKTIKKKEIHMVDLTTPTAQTSTTTLTDDNGQTVDMTVTYNNVNDIVFGSFTFPGTADTGSTANQVSFSGDGVRDGGFLEPDDDDYDSSTPAVTIELSEPVDGFSFTITDIDQIIGSFDDQVTVRAFDADGNPVPITIDTNDPDLVISADGSAGVATVEGTADASGNLTDGSEVTFTIDNVATIEIFYEDGTTDSNDLGVIEFELNEFDSVVRFVSGTLIDTTNGAVAIETITPNDKVLTVDRGAQPVRWIGERIVSAEAMRVKPKLRPVLIQAGALGNELPSADLRVSQQHRILVKSDIALRMFGEREVLVPAKKLVDVDGIDIDSSMEEVTYIHFLFDNHELVWSNGVQSESLFPGPEALKIVSPEARAEIEAIFPELFSPDFQRKLARLVPQARQTDQAAYRTPH